LEADAVIELADEESASVTIGTANRSEYMQTAEAQSMGNEDILGTFRGEYDHHGGGV
jgi:hypothetical protein